MRYVQINSFPNGSTGTIMRQVAEEHRRSGDECWLMWGRGHASNNDYEFNFGSSLGVLCDVIRTRLDGRAGFHSKVATRRLLKKLDALDPDVVHLHNLHGYYVNVEMLFGWLINHRCQVRWTLHDCWAFTGHCAYFSSAKCTQWQSHCAKGESCPQLGVYPKTYSKRSCAHNFDEKKRIFTSIPQDRMTLITPSHWLEKLVKKSFLRDYSIEVHHNTVDRTVFRPTTSDFRERFGIGNRFMILGVASPWTKQKGLDDFVRLSHGLDPERCVIVLVGLSNKQIRKVNNNIIALPKMESAEELAKVYTAADVFVHPGFDETFGMTVAEATACGTTVVIRKGSACVEAANGVDAHCVEAGFESLQSTISKLATGGCTFEGRAESLD